MVWKWRGERYYDLVWFDDSPRNGYLVTNPIGVIIEATQAASLVKVSQESWVGKLLAIFVAGSARQNFYTNLSQVLQSLETKQWEVKIQTKTGGILSCCL